MPGVLVETVREAARRFGSAPAFATPHGWRLSYASLDGLAVRGAHALRRNHGMRVGSVVALVLPSTVDYIAAYVAVATVGGATAGVNPTLTAPERARIVARAEPDLVLTTATLRDGLDPDLAIVELGGDPTGPDAVLTGLVDPDPHGPPQPGDLPDLDPDPDRPVAIVFTSGTTGEPKGAVFTDRQLRAIAALDWGLDRWGDPRTAPAMLAATQFAHVGFMTKLPWYLMTGGTTHLLARWRASVALELIATHRIPSVGGVAPQLALMLRDPDFDSHDFSAVRTIVMGGGPSPPALVREAQERFGAAYSIRYSSTESGGIGTATAFDADDEEALHTVGRPRPGVEVRVVDEHATTVPEGEVGELCLRSPTVMSGYWRDPDATADVLRDGWLNTGDLARIDGGLVRLAGRAKEMYVRGGYNVHPMEVEAVLAGHPDVAQVAVVARHDEVMGEVGVAVVVPRSAAAAPSLEALRSFARDRLAGFKLPEDILVAEDLPLTPMQKLDRRALERLVRVLER